MRRGGGVFSPQPIPAKDQDPLSNFQHQEQSGREQESGGAQEQESGGEHCQESGGESEQESGDGHDEITQDDHDRAEANAVHDPAPARSVLDMFRRGVNAPTLLLKQRPDPQRERTENAQRALNITVREAIRTRGNEAERVIMKELGQMISKRVWTPVDGRSLTAEQRAGVIRSSMFLKEKFFASGEFEKLKARLVAGGDQQDKDLYDDLSAPTVSTCSVFTILSIAAYEGRSAAVVDIGGAFLNAEMKTGVDVHMRLDKTISDLMIKLDGGYERYRDSRGCITVLLDRALYGCVESAALWYENLRETMSGLGYTANPYDICVFNRTNEQGTQCTAAVHVDDLLIVSKDSTMIESLAEGLRLRYGEIS